MPTTADRDENVKKVTNERIFKMAADKPHCNCANVGGKREMMLSSTTAVIQVTKRGNAHREFRSKCKYDGYYSLSSARGIIEFSLQTV